MVPARTGLLLALGWDSAAAQVPMSIGGVTAKPGEARSGTIAIAAGVDAATQVPITIIRGTKPGPERVGTVGVSRP